MSGSIEEEDADADVPATAASFLVKDVTWCVEEVFDEEPRRSHEAKLHWSPENGDVRSFIEYFFQMLPLAYIRTCVAPTNEVLVQRRQRRTSLAELLHIIAAMIMMSRYSGLCSDEVWEHIPFIKQRRYHTVLNALVFPPRENDTSTFHEVNGFIDAFNKRRERGFTPGGCLCADECMCEWQGKDQRFIDGCPHITKIIRKPKSVGIEIKAVCDVLTGICVSIELMAGKDEMRTRPFSSISAGCGQMLRMTKPWHGTGRVVVGDSAFASVKSAVHMRKQAGLHFVGMVKTASARYPKQFFNARKATQPHGTHDTCRATVEGVPMFACAWYDKKTKMVISTTGTTRQGKPHGKKHWINRQSGSKVFKKMVPRPHVHQVLSQHPCCAICFYCFRSCISCLSCYLSASLITLFLSKLIADVLFWKQCCGST